MDPKKFQELLTKYANWHRPKPEKTKMPAGRGRPTEEDLEYREWLKQDHDNPTLPPKLDSVKCQGEHCEDCGQFCPDGRKMDYRYIHTKHGKTYLRPTCVTCNQHQDPYTKQFGLTGTEASARWFSYVKPYDKRYKTKSQRQHRDRAMEAYRSERIIEDERSKITFYDDFPDPDK